MVESVENLGSPVDARADPDPHLGDDGSAVGAPSNVDLQRTVQAERDRGKRAKADEALALLRQEFPERVSEVTPES